MSLSVYQDEIQAGFQRAGIAPVEIVARDFPGEIIFIVEVAPEHFDSARALANKLEDTFDNAFITVRKRTRSAVAGEPVRSISDPRVTDLVAALNENVRAGHDFRNFDYIEDASGKIAQAIAQRHHLIFGRRGVGKTALLLEAKRRLEAGFSTVFWMNLKPLSGLKSNDAFLSVIRRLLSEIRTQTSAFGSKSNIDSSIEEASQKVNFLLESSSSEERKVELLIPELQQILMHYTARMGAPIFLMLDDVHTIRRDVLPGILDRLMAVASDANTWLKVAGIHHQMRYFNDDTKTGLEVPHDAQMIDLDVTLEDPARASEFLTRVLDSNLKRVGISSRSSLFLPTALDRLVLASGGVPRDFLVLSGRSIQAGRERENARNVGVQDVNTAAGRYYDAKIQELEDDAAAEVGEAKRVQHALTRLKALVLERSLYTYFKIDLRSKEQNPEAYRLIQSLGDFRVIHLLRSSISDEHQAGVRHEVYLLDIALYSSQRLRKNLNSIEFKKGRIVARKTGTNAPGRVGENSKAEQAILRRAPNLAIENLVD